MQKFNPRSAALTAFVHLMLFGLIWWGASWVQPKPAEVELWDAAGLAAAQQTQTTTLETTTPTNETEHTPVDPNKVNETDTPDDIETEVDVKTKSQTKTNESIKQKESPKPLKNKQEKTNLNQNNPNQSVLNNNLGKNGAGNDPGYVSKVRGIIERNGRGRGLSGQTGSVSFRVSPSGAVSGITISGFPADKKSVIESVIRASSPLPKGVGGVIPQKALSEGLKFTVKF